jgi:UPF0716 protein FxsA
MGLFILAAFIVLPFVELAVLIKAGQSFGFGPTILLMVAISVAGFILVRMQGFRIVRRIQSEITAGKVPTQPMIDGFLALFAAAMLMTPGFVTDILGIILLLPPTRAIIRPFVVRYFVGRGRRLQTSAGFGQSFQGRTFQWRTSSTGWGQGQQGPSRRVDEDIIDVEAEPDFNRELE